MSSAAAQKDDQPPAAGSSLFEAHIDSALARLPKLEAPTYRFDPDGHQRKGLDAEMLARAARNRGLDVLPLGSTLQIISSETTTLGFYQNMCWTLSALDRVVTNDKALTKRVLTKNGLPVAIGDVVDNADDAVAVFRSVGGPVVVKPITGSGGKGITVDVRDEAQLRDAIRYAAEHSERFLVEECIPSIDLRIMVVAGQAVAAMMRVPAHVTGDGRSSIAELVERKNVFRAANPYHRESLIELTEEAERRLADRGLSQESVPEPGTRVFLHYKANMSSGGDGVDVTSAIDPGILRLAEQVTQCFTTAHHAGVDILAERLDRPPGEQKCVTCEVNCNNDVPIHEFPHFGEPLPSCDREIDGYFFSGRDRLPMVRELRRTRSVRTSLTRVAHRIRRKPPARLPSNEWLMRQPIIDAGEEATAGDLPRAADQRQVRRALAEHGFEDVRYHRKLIFARRDGREVVFERARRSIFTTQLVGNRRALEVLLDDAGVPCCRRVRFRRDELAAAKELVKHRAGPWNVRAARTASDAHGAFRIARIESLERAWSRISAHSRGLIVEQAPESNTWRLLLVDGVISGCVACRQPAVAGDGAATIAELLERKRAQRAANPYLRLYPRQQRMPGDRYLSRRGLSRSDVLPRGEVLPLSKTTDVSEGADTVGYRGEVDDEIRLRAERVLALIGHPPLAAVTFAGRREGEEHHWAVADVTVDPILAEFAWPSAGEGSPAYRDVAALLSSAQHYVLE
ncbi:MAG: ATP-grasp domain-containing protein [Actinophytocola sp.]|nr:ATP-grasp domain-containing protein [Actinophytocola sp.]